MHHREVFSVKLPEVRKAYRQLALKYHPDKGKEHRSAMLFLKICEDQVLKPVRSDIDVGLLQGWRFYLSCNLVIPHRAKSDGADVFGL